MEKMSPVSERLATAPPDLLATIVGATRCAVGQRAIDRPEADVMIAASQLQPNGKRFRAALETPGCLNVIAECKRRSPSQGIIRSNYRPERIAVSYQQAGARAVSVLTEPTFFDGSLEHLRAVRRAVDLPVLRKDFIVTRYQLLEAVAAGADAVLLIVAALDDRELRSLASQAEGLGLAVLVEVHDRMELQRAVDAGARIIGVNNRNLHTLKVDLDATRMLIEEMPRDVVGVAESGLQTASDLTELGGLGYSAFLIGEVLMRNPDPGEKLKELLGNMEQSNLPVHD
jgi:indole-3-glycerol phosphate synthase